MLILLLAVSPSVVLADQLTGSLIVMSPLIAFRLRLREASVPATNCAVTPPEPIVTVGCVQDHVPFVPVLNERSLATEIVLPAVSSRPPLPLVAARLILPPTFAVPPRLPTI